MKNFYLILLFLFSFGLCFSQTQDSLSVEEQQRREKNIQAGNPFEKFGYKPKISTLSNGKYLEFHDQDSIVQIGSFTFHVKKKIITGYILKETKYSEATLRPEVVSRWFSPDPLADEFPNWSPYVFTNNNPIFFIDPTGLAPEAFDNDYGVDGKGNIKLIKRTEDKFDRLYAVDNDGNKKDTNSDGSVSESDAIKVNDQKILPALSKDDPNFISHSPWGKKIGAWAKTSNGGDAKNIFKFASDNTNVEWAMQEYSGSRFVIGNSHFPETVGSLETVSGYSITELRRDYHSHPGNSPKDNKASGQMGDQGRASSIVWRLLDKKIPYSNHPKFYIYRPESQTNFQYSPWNNKY